MKWTLLILIFVMAGCANLEPLSVESGDNINTLSKRIAENYTPGLMKAFTFAGLNTTPWEGDDYRSVAFKVKGESKEKENIFLAYAGYCSKINGEISIEHSKEISELSTLICYNDNRSVAFSIIIKGSFYNHSPELKCFSILGIEDKKNGMTTDLYARRLDWQDSINTGMKFHSKNGC